ncbi:MAG: hypothetical protein CMM99_04410 [Rickettsiales bacterium]|nr:hypothetical protein [Rickettsiales bacterium]|tara:strand:- start:126 stop:545 length:420 start_codon:yes stop_codon:yes gene_type:complete
MNIKILSFLLVFLSNPLWAGKLKINVKNINEKVGSIHFALYNKGESFPEKKGKILGLVKDAEEIFKDGLLIEDLKESNYAVAIFHDENSNDEFDTFWSIPQEKYGFSNDAEVFFGPPNFEDASFFVGIDDFVEIDIELR